MYFYISFSFYVIGKYILTYLLRQSGFRKLFSTTTAVLDVSEIILEEMNKNKFVGAVLIDLKKAFDTVDHKILLKNYGVMVFKTKVLSGLNHI